MLSHEEVRKLSEEENYTDEQLFDVMHKLSCLLYAKDQLPSDQTSKFDEFHAELMALRYLSGSIVYKMHELGYFTELI